MGKFCTSVVSEVFVDYLCNGVFLVAVSGTSMELNATDSNWGKKSSVEFFGTLFCNVQEDILHGRQK